MLLNTESFRLHLDELFRHPSTHKAVKDVFRKIYHRDGHRLYFVFRRSIAVTNMQFSELFALIGQQLQDSLKPYGRPVFLPQPSIEQRLADIANTYRDVAGAVNINKLAEIYAPLFATTIGFHPLYCSCIIFLPPGLSINLDDICGTSGYIHSCGPLLFVRNASKGSPDELADSVERELSKYQNNYRGTEKTKGVIRASVYSHERFTQYDSDDRSILANGLDAIKIYESKHHIRDHAMNTVVETLRKRLGDEIRILPHGNFRTALKKTVSTGSEIDNSRFLWITRDVEVVDGYPRPDRGNYYVVWLQTFKNTSYPTKFDENKPGWIAANTLPDDLAAAMINCAAGFGRRESVSKLRIWDPFAGSGTFACHALRFNDIIMYNSDIAKWSQQCIADNALFLSIDNAEEWLRWFTLNRFMSELKKKRSKIRKRKKFEDEVVDVRIALDKAIGNAPKTDVALRDRIVLYAYWHILDKYKHALLTRSTTWHAVSKTFSVSFVQAVRSFLNDLSAVEKKECHSDRFSAGSGLRIRKSGLENRLNHFAELNLSAEEANIKMIRKKFHIKSTDSIDIIVTDPPYSVNTNEDREQLTRVYNNLVVLAVELFRQKGGQLVLCLPAQSKTGRVIPCFATYSFVCDLLTREARRNNCRWFPHHRGQNFPSWLRGPHFWESEKALRRTILHAWITPQH